MKSVLQLTLVSAFASMVPPPVITLVSAGSHTSGSHSAAVDADGKLYTWGKASACGHIGSSASLSTASAAPLSSFFSNGGSGNPTGPVVFPRQVTAFKKRPVLKVSCGGGYTLAIACLPSKTNIDNTKTAVYSWGLWAGGENERGVEKRRDKLNNELSDELRRHIYHRLYSSSLRCYHLHHRF